ncbi:unnamed protein product [Auanema sp. JU1783]|nr:unnamed protein product [Auanema sp. JU1783]
MKRAAQIVSKSDTLTDIEDLRKEQVVYIKEMRKAEDAPVDILGCHKLADPLAAPEVYRFQVLLSLMLSSQTKDQVTAAAIMRLREYGCDADSMIKIPRPELEKLLFPVGFYKRKAEYVQKAAQSIKDNFKGDIPKTLCSLAGVGPKMGHLVMQVAWGKVEGIAVDTHVHRIVNRLGWMVTSTPEETRVKLQNLLPREEWDKINPLLVGFGQQICLPVKPHCDTCLCNHICPSSTYKKKVNAKEPKAESPQVKTEEPNQSPKLEKTISVPHEDLKLEVPVTEEAPKKRSTYKKKVNTKEPKAESPQVKTEEPTQSPKLEDTTSVSQEDSKLEVPVTEEAPKKRSNRRKK